VDLIRTDEMYPEIMREIVAIFADRAQEQRQQDLRARLEGRS
jgi:hypothetical protein